MNVLAVVEFLLELLVLGVAGLGLLLCELGQALVDLFLELILEHFGVTIGVDVGFHDLGELADMEV